MKFKCNAYWATAWQLLVALLMLWAVRFAFYFHNADVVGSLSFGRLLSLSLTGLRFDLVAVAYVNTLFILMRFMPFRFAARRGWLLASDVVYGVTNGFMLLVAMGDVAFFRFNGGHMQSDSFLSMFNGEMIATAFSYFRLYWWAFAAIAALIAVMLWLARRAEIRPGQARSPWSRAGLLLLAAGLTFLGMRGIIVGRPIGIDNAARHVEAPGEINVVLNTPFCILRSANYSKGLPPRQFFSADRLAALRNSVINPSEPLAADSIKHAVAGKNIVVIVLESGGQIWFDSLNIVEGDPQRRLMTFTDSLTRHSLCLTATYCTGGRTVAGLASITGGVPCFGLMNWMATKYGSLTVDTPPRLLGRDKGYASTFYLGANPDAFSIGPQARAFGFDRVIGKNDIDLPAGSNQNSWGFYDHIAGAYVARDLTAQPQPFFACWLTLDLHSPFNIPDFPRNGYAATTDEMEQAVAYTDYSLRCFFEEARRQPWFNNTLFVITADHGFRDFKGPEYNGAFIYGHVPFILYTPDGSLPTGKINSRPMAQFDIAPTLLWLAGYERPFVSVGTNWFDDSKPHYGLQLRNDMWQITSDRYLVRMPFDASAIDAVFDITADQRELTPLTDYDAAEVNAMVTWTRALLQDFTERADSNRLHHSL